MKIHVPRPFFTALILPLLFHDLALLINYDLVTADRTVLLFVNPVADAVLVENVATQSLHKPACLFVVPANDAFDGKLVNFSLEGKLSSL